MTHTLIIYSFENNNYNKNKEISLNTNRIYFSLKNISNNNFSLISRLSDVKSEILYIFHNPVYEKEEINLSDLDNNFADLIDSIYIDNLIIICRLKKDTIKIFIYNLKENQLEIKLIKINFEHNFYKFHAFKTNNKEIIISFNDTGYLFNIKSKQIVNLNKNYGMINNFAKIGKYFLFFYDNYKKTISQINLVKGNAYNNYLFSLHDNCENISTVFDLGNNQFCLMVEGQDIYLFKYK